MVLCKPQTAALSLSFLTDSSLGWYSSSVAVTTGSMRRYLQPNQVAQVVQLLQDDTFTHVVARRFTVEKIPTNRPLHQESWIGLQKDINPAAGLLSATLCEEEQEEHCQSPTK